jgi:RNA polymerase sigma factor (TIGR02999 family)
VGDITQLLAQVNAGDSQARDAVFEALYPELRRLAHSRLARGRLTMLDTCALVHECYMRFADAGRIELREREHFLAYAAQAMRSIIVDFARSRLTEKRGGGAKHTELRTELNGALPQGDEQIVQVHDALLELEHRDPRLARVVELRYFGGLSEVEIAQALNLTERTVRRDWEKARLLLAESLRE